MSLSKELVSYGTVTTGLVATLYQNEEKGVGWCNGIACTNLELQYSQKGRGWKFETSRLQAHKKGKRSRVRDSVTWVGVRYGYYLWPKGKDGHARSLDQESGFTC